jgi:hypothetical protein
MAVVRGGGAPLLLLLDPAECTDEVEGGLLEGDGAALIMLIAIVEGGDCREVGRSCLLL